MRTAHIGLAFAPSLLSAARIGRAGGVRSATVTVPALTDEDAVWSEVADRCRGLLGELDSQRPRLSISLLPPLVQVRRIDLPRMRDAELALVLNRDASRYFPQAGTPQVLAVQRIGRGQAGSEPVLAAVAPHWLVQRVRLLSEALGAEIETLAPAHAAWAAADRGRARQTLVAGLGSAEILRFQGDRVVDVRRVPLRLERILAALLEGPERTLVLLDVPTDLAASLSAQGFTCASRDTPAATLAAEQAGTGRRFELVPGDIAIKRTSWSRTLSRQMLAGAAALLLASLGLARWGLQRELTATLEARNAQRNEVAVAMQVRDRLRRLEDQVTLLSEAERRSPRWTAVVGGLAERLPDDAWISALRGTADTLLLEGSADQASGVFDALQRSREVVGVRATAPIRQVNGEDQTVERFSLTARLRAPGDSSR